MEGWKAGEIHGAFELKMDMLPLYAFVVNKSYVIAGIAGLGTGLIILLINFIGNKISQPLNELKEGANKVAAGNNDIKINVDSEEEIGKLYNRFNKSAANIKDIILHLTEAIDATASASYEISSSKEDMATGAQQQSS